MIYSITETAKLNELNPYYYLKYLLERTPELMNAEGAIAAKDLEPLLPWSESLPAKYHRIRRFSAALFIVGADGFTFTEHNPRDDKKIYYY